MSTAVRSLGPRLDRSPATVALAAGDLALIAAFVVVGELSHGVPIFEVPLRVVDTFLPFGIGWAVVAPVVGVYGPDVRRSARTAAVVTAVAWVGGALVGQGLRATSLFHGNFAPAFVVVSVLVGLALLVPWRVAVAALR